MLPMASEAGHSGCGGQLPPVPEDSPALLCSRFSGCYWGFSPRNSWPTRGPKGKAPKHSGRDKLGRCQLAAKRRGSGL